LGLCAEAESDRPAAISFHEQALAIRRDEKRAAGIAESALLLARAHLVSGNREQAIALLREAEALVAERSLAEPGPLPACYLALLGERDAASVPITERAPVFVRAEAHLVLHAAGSRREDHLREARKLLEDATTHLQGAAHEAFWTRVPVARALLDAEQH
jgi:tetratricopeptide (TPR) repeat protein